MQTVKIKFKYQIILYTMRTTGKVITFRPVHPKTFCPEA
jgi:hypothetical protein